MKRLTLRYIFILAISSLVGIVAIQIYWFSKAFDLREKQFSQTVSIALRNVADQLLVYNNRPIPQLNPVEQLSSNYYVVMVNAEIHADLLETMLINEFELRDLKLDFEYGIYDCVNAKMVFGNFVNLDESTSRNSRRTFEPPPWDDNDYYFGVLFPTKDNTLLGQMGIWIFSSGVLLVVLIFFAYALYVIFNQRRLSETQKQFINNMTHEFRTPISTIMLSSGVLRDPAIAKDIPRLANYAKIIQEESNRLLSQVENILQATMIEESKLSMNLELTDMNVLVANEIEKFKIRLPADSISMDGAVEKPMVFADKIHVSNAVKNLLDNAVKYTEGTPAIQVRIYNSDKHVLIDIQDNGIGIPKACQKKIFSKFYRIQQGNVHNSKGFGLGLHYVKNVLKLHGGKVYVKSEPGKGSTFTLKLPNAHG
ncbi:MAG: HAMP domain-containing sensor histidine kinase [Cyclobacteriaceae bacterium]|nr:HAMP domain-containing sensor histidine kinase [Cyclobacteriaceae bacterium]